MTKGKNLEKKIQSSVNDLLNPDYQNIIGAYSLMGKSMGEEGRNSGLAVHNQAQGSESAQNIRNNEIKKGLSLGMRLEDVKSYTNNSWLTSKVKEIIFSSINEIPLKELYGVVKKLNPKIDLSISDRVKNISGYDTHGSKMDKTTENEFSEIYGFLAKAYQNLVETKTYVDGQTTILSETAKRLNEKYMPKKEEKNK